jgi:soluble lytic murein transglycosylase-like protein
VFPVAVIAAIAVIAVAVSAYVMSPQSTSVGDAIGILPGSPAFAELEAERQELIAMTTAAGTLASITKPKLASPGQAAVSDPNASSSSASAGTAPVLAAPPDPTGAEAIAESIMGSYGFPSQTYYSCLYDLWERESSWNVYAENPSGAYGIPQSLPGSKMASAGADWLTDPTTQIRWGLGYIKAQYGNPCAAWNFEEANGFY